MGLPNGEALPDTSREGRLEAWSKSTADVATLLDVDLKTGLIQSQVDARRAEYGYNELTKAPGKPLWKLVLEQFDDMLVKVLLVAAVVSFVLAYVEGAAEDGFRAYIEPIVILLILILNAVVGVWQESNAEAALEALKELQTETARVVRNGRVVSALPARELVPGDVVELQTGDIIPADIRVTALRTALMRAEQASLTGEANPVSKFPDSIVEANSELQGKDNMLFAGTSISYGSCCGIVTEIGIGTELGKIHEQIQEAAEFEEDTPLKQKLNEFGELLAQVIFYICVTVWLINYRNFLYWESYPGSWIPDPSTVVFSLTKCTYYFKIAVALAVAAIPEGLPAVITTCLALGTRQMAKKNAIVRKLPSVETLGCTTVICSDKTGTLTTNQMSAVFLVALGDSTDTIRQLKVEGHTFNPAEGRVVGLQTLDPALECAAQVCAMCDGASIEVQKGRFKAVGNPTEAALLVLAEKLGAVQDAQGPLVAGKPNGYTRSSSTLPTMPSDVTMAFAGAAHKLRLPKLEVLEFDRERKSMSVLCKRSLDQPDDTGAASSCNVLLVKGAAEFVLQRCTQVKLSTGEVKLLDDALRRQLGKVVEDMAAKALRCLALAEKTDLGILSTYDGDKHPGHQELVDPTKYADIESNLVFLGLAGLEDPPRPEVPDAIASCHRAGIRVMVITGDNKLTAEAICREVGVLGEAEDLEGKSMTGRAFMELSDAEQRRVLGGSGGRCFSRAEPRHKTEIVRLLKEMGEVTAMTGDGVNDAPALKMADIGIAMGITGTEVAKEAAAMVLADDNFSSIVAAIEAGRAIFNNMKAFIRYMISSNIGEVASIFFTAALGLPENMIPVQLLWVNLVTDGPPATALGFNPPDLDIMDKPPRRKDESLVSPWIFFRWMVVGAYVGFATVAVFVAWYMYGNVLGLDISSDGHTTVTWEQLTHWQQCQEGAGEGVWRGFAPTPYTAGGTLVHFKSPCDYFEAGKVKASTLSLTTLVMIEMFNALNALSEDNSLLQMPPHQNPWLLVAMSVSVLLHVFIMYIPFFNSIFEIVPLSLNEWLLVMLFACPVCLIDEVLKYFGRNVINRQLAAAAKQKTE